MDGLGTKWRRNITKNFNRLSTAHERYRQTDDIHTDLRRHIANVNMSLETFAKKFGDPLNISEMDEGTNFKFGVQLTNNVYYAKMQN